MARSNPHDVVEGPVTISGLTMEAASTVHISSVHGSTIGKCWKSCILSGACSVAQPLNKFAELTDREQDRGSAPRFGDVLSDRGGGGDVTSIMPFRIGHSTRSPARLHGGPAVGPGRPQRLTARGARNVPPRRSRSIPGSRVQ